METLQKLEQIDLRKRKGLGKELQESDEMFEKENEESSEDWEELLKDAGKRKAAFEEQDDSDFEMHRTMD